MAPLILSLGCRCRGVVKFTLRSRYGQLYNPEVQSSPVTLGVCFLSILFNSTGLNCSRVLCASSLYGGGGGRGLKFSKVTEICAFFAAIPLMCIPPTGYPCHHNPHTSIKISKE